MFSHLIILHCNVYMFQLEYLYMGVVSRKISFVGSNLAWTRWWWNLSLSSLDSWLSDFRNYMWHDVWILVWDISVPMNRLIFNGISIIHTCLSFSSSMTYFSASSRFGSRTLEQNGDETCCGSRVRAPKSHKTANPCLSWPHPSRSSVILSG